jgi:hypothetical protein
MFARFSPGNLNKKPDCIMQTRGHKRTVKSGSSAEEHLPTMQRIKRVILSVPNQKLSGLIQVGCIYLR